MYTHTHLQEHADFLLAAPERHTFFFKRTSSYRWSDKTAHSFTPGPTVWEWKHTEACQDLFLELDKRAWEASLFTEPQKNPSSYRPRQMFLLDQDRKKPLQTWMYMKHPAGTNKKNPEIKQLLLKSYAISWRMESKMILWHNVFCSSIFFLWQFLEETQIVLKVAKILCAIHS